MAGVLYEKMVSEIWDFGLFYSVYFIIALCVYNCFEWGE